MGNVDILHQNHRNQKVPSCRLFLMGVKAQYTLADFAKMQRHLG